MSKTKNKGSAKNEIATTSTSSSVTSAETTEVVSTSNVVEESRQMTESESRSSTMEVTSGSREVIMDSKGNVIKVIETQPQTSVQQSSSSRKTGKSSRDFIAGEQMQSIKQVKTIHETPSEKVRSLSKNRVLEGGTIERAGESVQTHSRGESHSTVQQSVSSSTSLESTSMSEDHSGHRSAVVVSHDVRNKSHAPAIQTSSRSTESTRVSSETSEALTKGGQTVSNTTRIRETDVRVDDNGRTVSTSSREIDSGRTIAPSTAIKNIDDIERIGDGDARGDSKLKKSNVEISTRCNKPGQSAWDGTFVYEKPAVPKGTNAVDRTVSVTSKVHDDTRDGETSVKVTKEASSAAEISAIDQIVSSGSIVTRDSKTIIDEGLRDIASSERVILDTTKETSRRSKPGDSTWNGNFVVEKIATRPRRRDDDSDTDAFHHTRGDNVMETTQRRDFKEKSTDGTYEKELSETVHVVKGVTDSTRFISEERHDLSRESTTHVDGATSSKEEHLARVSSPSHRRIAKPGDSAWNGEFIYEKTQDDARKRPTSSDVSVIRRSEKRHDSVDVQDVTEEQNVSNISESVSSSYIVEYATTSDRKNVEKVTSVSEVIHEDDGSEGRMSRGSAASPDSQSKQYTTSRCYKPGQSTWDGTFVYERPTTTPDSRRKSEDRRTTKTIDIRDVTEDNSINEADVTSASYIVEHSSSQQSFSDVKDASLTSTIYETVFYEGRPVETTIRFDKGASRGKVTPTERHPTSSPRPQSPEKIPRDTRDTAKPGSSTWDGTFVQETKRPPSRESIDGRLSHPIDSKRTTTDTSKGRVNETTVDLRDITQAMSSTSEVMSENNVIAEQSSRSSHESYADSTNLDFSTTSVETVIIRDGQPVTTQKTVTILEGPRSPARRPSNDVITATGIKESTVRGPEKKEPRVDDRHQRPTKPGSSTWDGSFVHEKPKERSPSDKKLPRDGIADKSSPIKERPSDATDHRTSITISDASKDITSSVTIERSSDSRTYDASNVSKIFIEECTGDKTRATVQPLEGKRKPSPRQRPEDAEKPKDEKSQKSPPIDRSHRPTKPGASTWDGSFVYEKSEERRSSDGKASKDTPGVVDKQSPIRELPDGIADHKTSITILDTSKDVTSSTDYSTSSVTIERTALTDSKTYDISNVSKIFIEDSTGDKVRAIDYERLKRPSEEKPKPSPRRRPEDAQRPKDEKSQRSPADRAHRPSKPGASAWDGSFVYEKPQDTRKKSTVGEPIAEPRKPTDEKAARSLDQREKPAPISILRKATDERTPRRDVTEIKRVEDVADITSTDIARTTETIQQSSYVIDQSTRITSVQDARDVTDERVIAEFTLDTRKDARDVTESTKEFIDKEQVTSMVARDVIDDTRFDTVTRSASRTSTDSTKKPSPERPGYPRGIPGLREDDRPKSTAVAGKPSQPPQREKSPQRPGRPKPSRPAEKSEKSKKPEQDKPKRGDQSPDSLDGDVIYPKEMPVPDILSKIPLKEQCICELCTCGRHRCPHNLPQEHLEFPHGEPVHTVTSYRQDYDEKHVEKQTKYYHEDHLRTEGEFIGQRRTDYVATKGERAPVKKPQDHLKPEGDFVRRPKEKAPTKGERAPVRKPQDNLKPEGEFVGRPRQEAPKYGERAPITKPQDNLKFEGDFETTTTTELVFTGTPGERPSPIRRNTYTKVEGDFIDETTTRSQFIDHRSIQRAEIIKRTDNLTVGEGEFTGTSRVKEDFQTYVIEREPQRRPRYTEDTDRFYNKTDITDSTTTTQEQYRTFDRTDYRSTAVIKRADNLKPEGPFEALPRTKDDYIAPILSRRPEPQKPKDNLKPEGPFEGRPKDDYRPTRGERADVKRPEDNLRPEGPFEGRPKDDFIPKTAERPEVKRPIDNLRPEGDFVDRPKGKYTPAERRTPIRHPDNLYPDGDFERPESIPYGPGDRASIVRHPDNLFPIGEFPEREIEPFVPAERRTPIKHDDNLRPEGDFIGRPKDDYKPTKGERADVKRPEDNLRPEGPFEGRSKNDYIPKRAERPEVKRPEDNLRPEGDFERPEKTPIGPAERRTPIKHADNLKPEGAFERPRQDGYRPAERPEVKKPMDNLKPEGEFERPRPEKYSPAEKRTPVKHPDNLKPEGEFVGKPKDYAPIKGDRADVKRPEDNLRPEGPFEGRPKDDYRPVRGERMDIVKRTDNLRMEGDIETYRSRDEYTDFLIRERAEITKYEDNLRMEGEFIDTRTRDDFKIVKGERMDVVRHVDNLRPEGPFEGRPKDDYTPKRAERPEIKKPEDNLKPEGDFVRRPKEEAPKKGERADVKKPKDNLRPEGDFERPEKKPIGPAERRTPIKHSDNLKPEGEFERRKPEEFKPAERPIVKKPHDNLKPEGDFVSRLKEEAPKKGDRADIKKPKDNLKPEGSFERPEKSPIGPAERRTPIKHADNLKPEGEFERPEQEGYRPAERPEVKKPIDNLKPEGAFERPRPEKFSPAEKRTPVKHPDNLKPEGEFIGKPKEDFTPTRGDRADVKKPEDNLRPEGPFEGRPKDDYRPVRGERMDIVKRTDNLRMEGDIETYRSRDEYTDFVIRERAEITKYEDNLRMEGKFIDTRTRDDFKIVKGERVDVVKHLDNLRPEGPFEGRPKDDYTPKRAERPEIKKPEDNLKPEGEFVRRPKEEAPKKGERADIKKPEDNLRPEGDFERPEKKSVGPAERRTPIKHSDNLKPEGEFERRKPEEFKPAERPVVKKPHDNLKPEGEFVSRPKEEAPKKGDRADVKKPRDNLKPEGDFERPQKKTIGPAERRSPIKHSDNLRPEGEFERPMHEGYRPAEKPQVKKPSDNLRPEGDFERPDKKPVGPGERRIPIKHADNLRPEGDFVGKPKEEAPRKGDRADVKKPVDNLKPEGEFERPEKAPIGPAEKRTPIKHPDNLRPEGEFEKRPKEKIPLKGDRADVTRPKDNLRPEGDFERPQKSPIGPAERRTPIRHEDNLYPEGDFVQRPKEPVPKGDRAPVKKPKDNLKPEGDFERPAKSPIGPAERRSPIKHPDNLHPEGEFVGRPKKDTPLRGDRADVKKPRDNLRPEGEFMKRTPKKVEPAERRTPIKHEDNLHPEGDFYIVPKDDYTPKRGDRSPVKRPQDNLRPEGEMEVSPKDDYRHVNGERVEIRRHEDHLRMEGQMDIHRSRDDYKKITKMEKVDVRRREDNLRMEGEFIDVRRKDDYVHVIGERMPIKKHPDNLHPEGGFDRPSKPVIGPAERRSPIKHSDNLKPEGDFERRTPSKIGPGERRSPIRHTDNLKPEGDFVGRPRDDFTPKRAEKIEVVKREDNLRMTGDFEGTTSHKSTYTMVRGERADIKSHEDNLKISTGAMETKTTSRDTYAPSKQEISPTGKAVNRRRHMESSITLGDDAIVMTTTNQRNYNTYTKRMGKDIAAKMSQMESDTRKTVESQTLTDGGVVTTVKRTTTSAQADQRVANAQTVTHQQQMQQHVTTDRRAMQSIDDSPSVSQPVDSQRMTSTTSKQHYEQHQRTQHSSEQHSRSQNTMQTRRTIEDKSIVEGLNHRGHIVRGEDASRYAMDVAHGEHHRQQQQQQQQQHMERHHHEVSRRDYVNAQHTESRQRTSASKQHEQHTISSQARYNSNSPEFRQTIDGQTNAERSRMDSTARINHHRKNVISTSSADVSNAVLHRRGGATISTEALHTISSTAADQRKSISNLAESGQYISNSSQSSDRRSLTSLHRSSKDANPWASSSYERPQRIVRHDNLTVGGKFYSQSEAKNYGNFSQNTQKIERIQKQANVSHINLGDSGTVSHSMYKREFVPRHRGPCPATLLEAKQAPFKHTRDTQKHKFYMPVVSN